eukprot:758714-Rhodomonas_salina.1
MSHEQEAAPSLRAQACADTRGPSQQPSGPADRPAVQSLNLGCATERRTVMPATFRQGRLSGI